MASFATLDEADTYFESVLFKEAWLLSNDADRTTALAQATRIIETVNYSDFVAPYPQDVIDATSEIALKLLEGFNPDEELELSRIKSHTFDRIKQVNKEGETPLHIIAGIPSATAFRLLHKYLPNQNTVRLDRVD